MHKSRDFLKVVLLYIIIYALKMDVRRVCCKETVNKDALFVIKPTRCTNFTNLFCHETLYVSDSSSVHHQEFVHCTFNNGICHTRL